MRALDSVPAPPLPAGAGVGQWREWAADLAARGCAQVRQYGLDLAQLQAEAEALLGRAAPVEGSAGGVVRASGELGALSPALLQQLHLAAEGYLGAGAVFEGYVALRLTNQLRSAAQYVSGHWHHDRCGRRVKAFIFLNKVDPSVGRPTLVVPGSHSTLWFDYSTFEASRFDDPWVRRTQTVQPMVGDAGGGFLFDTNALHRGVPEGSVPRTTVVLEWSMPGKTEALRGAGFVGPCPDRGMHRPAGLPWLRTAPAGGAAAAEAGRS